MPAVYSGLHAHWREMATILEAGYAIIPEIRSLMEKTLIFTLVSQHVA